MARLKDREKAISLRKLGMSYGQIRKNLTVSKSTLSSWLKEFPLTEDKIKELQRQGWEKSEASRERFRMTMRRIREKRLAEIYRVQKKIISPLNDRELFLAGLFLYWGEGSKCRWDGLSVSNTDPSVIKFFIYWLNKSLDVSLRKLRVSLQLYNDMEIAKEVKFWSGISGIPISQFIRPYVKATSSMRINHKGGFGHGTCNVRVNSVNLAEKIFMSIKAISDSI